MDQPTSALYFIKRENCIQKIFLFKRYNQNISYLHTFLKFTRVNFTIYFLVKHKHHTCTRLRGQAVINEWVDAIRALIITVHAEGGVQAREGNSMVAIESDICGLRSTGMRGQRYDRGVDCMTSVSMPWQRSGGEGC